jgi:large subunit ribosomal protein L21
MYAIVDIAGQQFKVKQAQKLKVHRLEAEAGKHVELDKVLMMSDGKTVTVGTPMVEGARVAAKVISHGKGDKVLVFKKKRRKGYQKLNGHRQYITELWIEAILGKGEKFDASKSTAPKPVVRTEPAKKVKKEAAPKAEAPAKKAAPKKAAAKKAAPKKAAAKKAAPKKDDKK